MQDLEKELLSIKNMTQKTYPDHLISQTTVESSQTLTHNRDYYLVLNQLRASYFERILKDLVKEKD